MSILFSHFFQKINEIAPLEADFTEVLDAIAVKPKMLYFYGNLPQNVAKISPKGAGQASAVLSSGAARLRATASSGTARPSTARPKTVAIVGSRHNSRYGAEVAYDLAYKLAQRGVVIVSGLAYGIDSIAHKGCLDAGGVTVAVLGTPIDEIYPREHLPLAERILKQNGAVMSEYAPGAQVFPKTSFLERNRLIAGLSDIVVVVEAAERSGSLNTASHALAQGKDVFAAPGNITSFYSVGCNHLIAQGAMPYLKPDDILRLLFPEDYVKKRRNKTLQGSTPAETAVLTALSNGLRDGEQIALAAELTPGVFNQTITILELKGRVRALGANQWSLA